jgi:amidase
MTDLHFLTATDLAAMVRGKKIGARELLEHFLGRVETHNTALNAIIWMDTDGARAAADAIDTAVAAGTDPGPLAGVPMTVKESFNVAGSPTTWGNPDLRDNIDAEDGDAARRMRAAGAVIFGKTNVPLHLADWQSFNEIYGTTNNPWDVTRTPGGSSGGAGAALAAGLTGLEIGSDIGASIRNPAHYCGVFGHKPTFGIVPSTGHSLPGHHVVADIAVFGPLARGADDLALQLSIIAGPEPVDATPWRLDLPPARHRALKDYRVAVMLSDRNAEVDREYQDILQGVADKLAAAGAMVSDTARPDVDTDRAMEVYIQLLRPATSGRHDEAEMAAFRAAVETGSPDDRSYYMRAARAATMPHKDWLTWSNERIAMRHAWADFFTQWDILLCPAASSAAWPHDQEGARHDRMITVNNQAQPTTDQFFWAGFPGMAYLPSTVSPAGLTKAGLPVGLQAVAAHGEDYTSIEFCRLAAEVIGGFTPPPGF